MPAGVPVATVSIGGAKNAGLLAVKILATVGCRAQRPRSPTTPTALAALVEEKNERLQVRTMSLAASPIRYPDLASRTVMTRRAWWLVVLNFLIPGSAQVLAGNRKLGRFGLGATLALWVLAIAALVVWIFWPAVLYTVFSTTITLWVVAAVLAFYAVLWVVLTFDTLRLVRLVKTAPVGARRGSPCSRSS